MPVRDGVEWLSTAIDSVLAQTRHDFELLIVDDGSSDGSLETAQERKNADDRIRVVRAAGRPGAVANHNRCVELARGSLLKFLHQDDALEPTCLELMAEPFDADPAVGLVFSRRTVVLEERDSPAARAWKAEYGELHDGFRDLRSRNRGLDLLDQYVPHLAGPVFKNWIGEPSAVMVSRAAIERAGPFDARIAQSWDLDQWLRIMAVADVGFVGEPLVVYRHHLDSLTGRNARRRAEWLDLLWIYESLLAQPALAPHHPRIRRFRRRRMLGALRVQLRRIREGDRDLAPLRAYLRARLGA